MVIKCPYPLSQRGTVAIATKGIFKGKMIPYSKNNKILARNLRNNMTDPEKRLWYKCLSLFPVRFNRQKRLGNYIADFYCHKAKLVIELDGEQHYEEDSKLYDIERTKFLEKYGLMVIRFTNYELKENFNGICEYIENILKERLEEFGYNSDIWDDKKENLPVS